MTTLQTTAREDVFLWREDYENMSEEYQIYFLNQRQVALLLSVLRYAEWDARWKDRDRPADLIEDTIRELTVLNAKHLIKSNLVIMAALTGRTIDLSNDDITETMIDANWDFSEDGVVPTLRDMAGINNDYSDELATIALQLGVAAL